MIPSKRWFPTNLPARALWMQNFATQFALVAASLGFTVADVTGVENDNTALQYLADIYNQIKAYEDAVRQYRIIITEGDIGKTNPQFPANPKFALPVTVDTGMFERLNNLVERIRVAPGYTDEIGALLGILTTNTERPSEDRIKPVITVTPQFSGYKFLVHATRMGKSAYKVQIRRMDSEAWTDAGFSTVSDVEITVTPKNPGQPERIQARVILMDKNQPVGEPSDAVYVTVNP
ncbi:MAG: hypothetical protein ABWZ66_10335 [Pyrinomonadaceae bacterium]